MYCPRKKEIASADVADTLRCTRWHHDDVARTDLQGRRSRHLGAACPLEDHAALGHALEVIRRALEPLAGRIDRAFVFGSVASGRETAASDIDLLIIGHAGFAEVVGALHPVQETLGRELNPKIYRPDEWTRMMNAGDACVMEVMAKPRMDVVGGGHEPG